MLGAYGHTVIGEFPAEKYIDEKLHRSTTAATLLVGKIPSFTVELERAICRIRRSSPLRLLARGT